MARIVKFETGTQEIAIHRSEVVCFHQVVLDGDQRSHLHLSTFGSQDRASAPKSSQSLQIGKEEAKELMAILLDTFPDLAPSPEHSTN